MRKVFVRQTLCRLFYFWAMVAQPILAVLFSPIWQATKRAHQRLQHSGEPVVFSRQHGNMSKQRISKSFRMMTFADPHPLTPIESHSCKNRGRGVAQTSVRSVFNLIETEPREIHCPELEEGCAAGATAGVASLIKIGHRGNAKFPATSSITFTWQT